MTITRLLHAMGYQGAGIDVRYHYSVDAAVQGDGPFGPGTFVVEAKRYRGTVDVKSIHALYGVVMATRADGGMLITTGRVGPTGREFARERSIHLVAGDDLVRLLAEYLGVEARLDVPPDSSST